MENLIPIFVKLCETSPTLILVGFFGWGLYKVIVFLKEYFFDSEKGQITLLLAEQRSFIKSVKDSNEKISIKIIETDAHIGKITDKVDNIEKDVDEIRKDVTYIKTKME